MLTARGWWLLVIAFVLLFFGVLANQVALSLVSLTLIIWFAGQALLFVLRVHFAVPRIRISREVWDERGPVDALWAGQTFDVSVLLELDSPLGLPYVAASDWVPFGAEAMDSGAADSGPLTRDESLELAYRIRCPAVGRARFEGVRLRLGDLHGFFYAYHFVRDVRVLRILPVLTDDRGLAAGSKRHNLLPPPGIHRLRRPGSGSELLDLRDYMPGDPPRTIAWKVSARRDKLITKEFESEVPLRCTLFVDTSASVRLGPPGKNALARVTEIAAAVAQANAGNRDLTGLCLFDDRAVRILRPARTKRHLAEVLHVLAEAAGLPPAPAVAPAAELVPVAYAFTREVYPEWLRPAVNHVPFWLPSLWPVPAAQSRRPTLGRTLGRWLFWLLSLIPFAIIALALAAGVDAAYDAIPERIAVPRVLLYAAEVLGLILFYPKLLELGRGFVTQLVQPRERRQARWRKQLAAILALRYGLGPGGIGLLMEDDELLSQHLQRFLAEHDVPYSVPLYDNQGRYQHAAAGKVEVLTRALLQAVGKGHDNELFVLLVDLLEITDELPALLRAVRVALARHHQVMVIAPWPPGVPPVDCGWEDKSAIRNPQSAIEKVLVQTAMRQHHEAYQRLRTTFARIGVPVICAAAGEPVPLILNRMDRLRPAGRRR